MHRVFLALITTVCSAAQAATYTPPPTIEGFKLYPNCAAIHTGMAYVSNEIQGTLTYHVLVDGREITRNTLKFRRPGVKAAPFTIPVTGKRLRNISFTVTNGRSQARHGVRSAFRCNHNLQVTQLSLAKNELQLGENYQFTYSVKNTGTRTITGFQIDSFLTINRRYPNGIAKTNRGTRYIEDQLVRLKDSHEIIYPEQSKTIVLNATLPTNLPNGRSHLFLCVRADPNLELREASETDNTSCKKITIVKPKPDLSLTLKAPTRLAPGANLRNATKVTVINLGAVAQRRSTADMVWLYLSKDDTLPTRFSSNARPSAAFQEDGILPGTIRSSKGRHLQPGRAYQYAVRATIPKDTPPGNYKLCALADPVGHAQESNEENNLMCKPVRIEGQFIPPIKPSNPRFNMTPATRKNDRMRLQPSQQR